MERKLKVYIYGLINDVGGIIYVGKSSNPKSRLTKHHSDLKDYNLKMKILDVFYDLEVDWIYKLLKDNQPLQNSQIQKYSGDHNIGDIIEKGRADYKKIQYSGKLYNSINQLYTSRDVDLSLYNIRKVISNPNCELAKEYPITLI